MTPAQAVGRLSSDGCAIFLFHGVVERHAHRVRNYTRKHLAKDDFATLMKALSGAGTPLSLDRLVAHAAMGEPLPPRSFAVTFDDGFRNNLTVAAPVLADFGIPATFYVTTGFVADNLMSWIDRIEFAVETVLERGGGGDLRLPWGRRGFDGPDTARALLDDVRRAVKGDARLDPQGVADAVEDQLGLPRTRSGDGELDRKLDWDELRQLAAGPGFTVGGHSHTHAILSFLDDEALGWEVRTSLDLLRTQAGIDTTHYSYPEGLAHCYSNRVIELLRREGIACCPTAEDGINRDPMDLFRLKRIMVA